MSDDVIPLKPPAEPVQDREFDTEILDLMPKIIRYGHHPSRDPRCADSIHGKRTTLDVDSNEIRCDACGDLVDPYFVIKTLQSHWGRYVEQCGWDKDERDRLRKQGEALKAEERRIKARLRNARRQLGPRETNTEGDRHG